MHCNGQPTRFAACPPLNVHRRQLAEEGLSWRFEHDQSASPELSHA